MKNNEEAPMTDSLFIRIAKGKIADYLLEVGLNDEIKPYENNPRDNDDAVDAVANSIKEFGWQQPIVVDNEGVIIAGHTRLR